MRKLGRPGLGADEIDRLYTLASLGELSADELWRSLGVDPVLEDDYLAAHRLVEGTERALAALETRFELLACLSNDVSRWSEKLRRRFGLQRWITDWFISGDMGTRKPSHAIYQKMLTRLGVEAKDVLFVDDRSSNLDAAQDMGIDTLLFKPSGGPAEAGRRTIRSLAEIV